MANCIATCDPPYHIIPQSVPLGHNLQTLLFVIFIIFMHNLPQLCLNGLSANLRPKDKHYLLRICNVVQKVMWFWSFFNNLIEKLKVIVHKYWSNAPLEICLRSTMWIVLLAEQFWHIAWKVSKSVFVLFSFPNFWLCYFIRFFQLWEYDPEWREVQLILELMRSQAHFHFGSKMAEQFHF